MITALVAASATTLAFPQDTTTRDTIIRMEEYVVRATRAADTDKMNEIAALTISLPALGQRSSSPVAADVFRDLTGVHVQQTSAGQGSIVLRGLVGNQVLMLVNGVPLNNGTYRDGPGQYLATVDPETIDRIEIIRGPASVLYGSDAQGGVVNIITTPHVYRGERSVRIAGMATTSNLGYRGRFSAGLDTERWRFGVGGTLQYANDLRAGGGLGRQIPTGFDAAGLDAEVEFRLSDEHTFSGVVQHFNMVDVPRYDRYVDFRAPAPGRDAEHLFRPQTRQLGYFRYGYRAGTGILHRLDITGSLSVQREGRHRIRRESVGPDSIRTNWRDDVYTPGISVVGRSILALGASPISLTWGTEWYHDQLNSSGEDENLNSGQATPIERTGGTGPIPSGNFPDGADADRFGVFLAAEYPIIEQITVTAGGRFSLFRSEADNGIALGGSVENSASQLTGQIGVVVAPHRQWRIAARVAQGFRAPNLYDLTRAGPVPGGVSLPNPNAQPEKSVSSELSLRYGSSTTAFDITGYYSTITDFIDRAPSTFNGDTLFNGERVFQGINVGEARVWGIEAEAVQQIGPVQARTNLFFTRGDQTPASGLEEPMSKIPPFNGMIGLRWATASAPVWVEYIFRWSAEQDRLGSRDESDTRIPDGGTPGYAVHGVRAGASLMENLDVSAGFDNIADKLYRTHASGVDAAARHVWIGLNWVGSF